MSDVYISNNMFAADIWNKLGKGGGKWKMKYIVYWNMFCFKELFIQFRRNINLFVNMSKIF